MKNIKSLTIILLCFSCISIFSFAYSKPNQSISNTKQQQLDSIKEKRIALVIGNSHYKKDTFIYAVNDAKLVMDSLKKVNFEVTLLTDATYDEITIAIDSFLNKLSDDTTAVKLFYFTGNGFEAGGKKYFQPVDKEVNNKDELFKNTICINNIYERFPSPKKQITIFALDLPRVNPFADDFNKGLAPLSPVESVILYSTSPGRNVLTKRDEANSIFARLFGMAVLKKDMEFNQLFKKMMRVYFANTGQSLWAEITLSREFYFNPGIY